MTLKPTVVPGCFSHCSSCLYPELRVLISLPSLAFTHVCYRLSYLSTPTSLLITLPAAFQNPAPQTKFQDPHPAHGPPLCASRVERTQATPPVRSLRGEGEGDLGSLPGYSLLKPIPPVLGRSVVRPPLVAFSHPVGLRGVIWSRVVQASPSRTVECGYPAAGLGAS